MKKPTIPYVGDKRIRQLLEEYGCPTPFHAVRTRFLGNIASLRFDASPVQAIKDLWGGELPEFEEIDGINALFQGLLSLWNHLTQHQSRSKPFRLLRETAQPMREDVAHFCRVRQEEIEGFFEGLFGADEEVDLPERAAEGMDHLGETTAMFEAARDLCSDPSKEAEPRELKQTIRHLQTLSRIVEKDIHAIVLACVRARRQALAQSARRRPTVH